jgi:hypothetical protein
MSNPASDLNQPADVLIVGGGSAGATLAARLSEDPNRRVLLLEAGPAFTSDQLPAELSNAEHVAAPTFDWGYTARGGSSTAEMVVPRGRVLGGSSAVNAAVAIRAASRGRRRQPGDVRSPNLDGPHGWGDRPSGGSRFGRRSARGAEPSRGRCFHHPASSFDGHQSDHHHGCRAHLPPGLCA